jgi:hypothetical protein
MTEHSPGVKVSHVVPGQPERSAHENISHWLSTISEGQGALGAAGLGSRPGMISPHVFSEQASSRFTMVSEKVGILNNRRVGMTLINTCAWITDLIGKRLALQKHEFRQNLRKRELSHELNIVDMVSVIAVEQEARVFINISNGEVLNIVTGERAR